MEVVLFHIRPRVGVDVEEYEKTFVRMMELVAEIPGFLGFDGFAGEDGAELAVARFESAEAIRQWREHPEHVATRERGRREFFESYDITIATTWKRYGWSAQGGEVTVVEDRSGELPLRG